MAVAVMQGAYMYMYDSNATFFYPFVGETGGRKDEEGLKPPAAEKERNKRHNMYRTCIFYALLRRDP